MKRTNVALSILLAVQLVAFGLGYVFCGSEQVNKASRVLLLKGMDRDSIQSLTIEDKDGKSIKLAHAENGWNLPGRFGFPADSAKVDRIVGKLLGLESVYVVSRDASHNVDLEVGADNYRRKVTLEGPKSKKLLIIGKTGSDGYTNVRVDPEKKVYAIDGLKAWEMGTRVSDWVERDYLKVEKKRLARLEIKRGDTDIVIERNNLAEWKMNGQPANKKEADGLADKAVKIEVSDVVGLVSDAANKNKVDQGKTPVTVLLSLAAEELPENAAAAKSQPAKDEAKPAGKEEAKKEEGEAGQPKAESAAPEINERHVLHIAMDPNKDTNVYCYSGDSKFVIKLDKWRVKKFFEETPEKLTPKK